jgi:hypothetical protein
VEILSVAGVAIAVVSFVGLCAVYLRGSSDKGTMESQKRSIEALTTELGIEKAKRVDLEHRVGTLEIENTALKNTVQHLPELERIEVKVDKVITILQETAA